MAQQPTVGAPPADFGAAPQLEPESEPEPEPEPEPEEDEQGCVDKGIAMTLEYRDTLSVLPFYWKIIWAVVLLLWVPIAYTVAAPVPGSMLLFLIAWTTFVLRKAGQAPQEDVEEPQPAEPGQVAGAGAVGDPQSNGVERQLNHRDVWTTRSGVPVTLGPPLPSVPSEDIPAHEVNQPAWFQPIANPLFQDVQTGTVSEV